MLITIAGIFRNNQVYIKWLIDILSKIELKYTKDIQFEYCFFENDSIDSSPLLLQQFIKTRNGKLTCEKAKKNIDIKPIIGRGNNKSRSVERTQILANYRNKCIQSLMPLKSNWTLFLDSDIYFNENIISQFLHNVNTFGTIQNIVMFTANTIDIRGFYFDTWAHKDINDKYFSQNYLIQKYGDAKIFSDIKIERENWIKGKPILVNSAFGGYAFIKSAVLNKCKWSAPNGCEHWEFCKMVRTHGNICICPAIICTNKETKQHVISKPTTTNHVVHSTKNKNIHSKSRLIFTTKKQKLKFLKSKR